MRVALLAVCCLTFFAEAAPAPVPKDRSYKEADLIGLYYIVYYPGEERESTSILHLRKDGMCYYNSAGQWGCKGTWVIRYIGLNTHPTVVFTVNDPSYAKESKHTLGFEVMRKGKGWKCHHPATSIYDIRRADK